MRNPASIGAMLQGNSNKAQLENIKTYINTPIATYTHTSNIEVSISSIDIVTNTFTSIGHGLENGDIVYPILNIDSGNNFLLNRCFGGAALNTQYYVINADLDTFKLSLTNEGVSIDLIDNANIDLTKWHFEKITSPLLVISDLPNINIAKVKFRGRVLKTTLSFYIYINGVTPSIQEWYIEGSTSPTFGRFGVNTFGDIWSEFEASIDYTSLLNIRVEGCCTRNVSASTSATALISTEMVCPNYRNGLITDIFLSAVGGGSFANGTIVEVYRG